MPPHKLLQLGGPVGLKALDQAEKKELEFEQPLVITEGKESREGRGNNLGLHQRFSIRAKLAKPVKLKAGFM
jgi:hypothetical protein